MPTPTPPADLTALLTRCERTHGPDANLTALARHVLALSTRLAAVEARGQPDAPTFERIAAAYTKQTLDLCAAQDKIAELARGIDILRADSDGHNRRAAEWQHKVGELTVRAEEAERQRADALDKVTAAYASGRADAWAATEREIADLRAKLAAAEDTQRRLSATSLAIYERDTAALTKRAEAAEAKLAALVPAHDKAMADLAVSEAMLGGLLAVIHRDGGHYAEEHGAAKAAEDAKTAVVALLADRDRLAALTAEHGRLKADLARLTKPGPASDEELRSVWCKAHREAMSAAGQHYRALTAAERALYTYGLAHARAEQAVLPTCRLTIEDDDDGYKAICEDGVGIAKSRSTTACKRIVAALSAAEHRRESERDAVADFIYGHAKRLGEQSGADGDELMVEIHDVLNHLRADENGEVFDGRAEQAAAPAPDATDEEIAMAVDGYLRSHRGWGEGHGHRSDLTAAITTVVRPLLVAASEERAQREEIRFEANITAVAKQRDEAIARVQQAEQERDALVVALTEWCLRHGAALKPIGANTFGEGMREAKAQVAAIVRDRPVSPPVAPEAEPPAAPREVVTVEEIVGAWDSLACNAPTSSLPSDAVRAAVERFVGSVIAAGGGS